VGLEFHSVFVQKPLSYAKKKKAYVIFYCKDLGLQSPLKTENENVIKIIINAKTGLADERHFKIPVASFEDKSFPNGGYTLTAK